MNPRVVAAAFCGALFGIGLAISHMTDPDKILAFLDVRGDWDPSLVIVLAVASATAMLGFALVLRRRSPILEREFERPARTRIDGAVVVGSAIFGVGWGLTGYCPGPSAVAATRLSPDALVFAVAFLVGSFAYRRLLARASSSPPSSLPAIR